MISALLLLATLSPQNMSTAAPSRSDGPVQVAEVRGVTWVVTGAGTAKEKRRPLSPGVVVPANSRIVTEKEGELKLRLAGGAAVSIRPGTSVELEQIQKKDWLLRLEDGAVHASVSNPAKRPGFFRVRTRTATMGVRGTTFFVRSTKDESDFLCTCKGTVRVADTDGKGGVDFTTQAHDKPQTIRPGTDPIEFRLAPIAAPFPSGTEHGDADVEALEHLAR